jgi:predicted dehydrogenase
MRTHKGKINRRQFIKGVGGAVAAGAGIPFVLRSFARGEGDTTPPSERITLGCIGTGGQGTYNMNAFMRIPGVQVVAICDIDKGYATDWGGSWLGREPSKALVDNYYAQQNPTGTYKDCAAYSDFRELLARGDIDAVTVCTPDHWHGTISTAAALAGKDIYCEKPLVNTIAEGIAVRNAVNRYKRILQTGSHERSNNSVRFACELVRNGRIGKVHTITVNMPNNDPHHLQIMLTNWPQPIMPVPEGLDYDMWLGPTPRADYTKKRSHFWWRFILDYGGGEMTDRGAHIIDLAQFINGTDGSGPVEISGEGKTAPGGGLFNAFMEYKFECRYANGVRLVGTSNEPRGLKIEGSDGWIFIHIHGGQLEASSESLLREQIHPGEIHVGRSRSHQQNFIDAVRTRQQPFASVEVGHRTATICHLVNIAMLTGKKLKWDPEKEVIVGDEETNRMLSRPMRSPWNLT